MKISEDKLMFGKTWRYWTFGTFLWGNCVKKEEMS